LDRYDYNKTYKKTFKKETTNIKKLNENNNNNIENNIKNKNNNKNKNKNKNYINKNNIMGQIFTFEELNYRAEDDFHLHKKSEFLYKKENKKENENKDRVNNLQILNKIKIKEEKINFDNENINTKKKFDIENIKKNIIKKNLEVGKSIFTNNGFTNPEYEIMLNGKKLEYDFDEYEEKILFHYAGLGYKLNENENDEERENYFSQNWQYVIVFPNPDYNKEEKFIETSKTYDLYDFFFKADESQLSNLQAKNCEKKIFNYIIDSKINDNLKNICLENKGGCLRKSKNFL
jgi:hypothetical protein